MDPQKLLYFAEKGRGEMTTRNEKERELVQGCHS